MRPIKFAGMDQELQTPANWSSDLGSCGNLPIARVGDNMRVSYWKPSWKERFALLFGSAICFLCVSTFHPPVSLTVVDVEEIKEWRKNDIDSDENK